MMVTCNIFYPVDLLLSLGNGIVPNQTNFVSEFVFMYFFFLILDEIS